MESNIAAPATWSRFTRPSVPTVARGRRVSAGVCPQGEGAWRRRGDVVVRTCHVLELATKLFLVVQNAVGAPPVVNIATE